MKTSRFKKGKKLSTGSNYRKWADWKAEDWFIGEFESKEEGEYRGNPSPKWHCKWIDASFEVLNKAGKAVPMKEGDSFTLNSAGTLNFAMEKIVPGQIVEVVFKGKGTMVKDGETIDVNQMEVSLLEEDEEAYEGDL